MNRIGFILALFLTGISGIAADYDYRAAEMENLLHLRTPTGEKTVIGDYGITNYRIEIPREDLEPKKKPRSAFDGEGGFNTNTNSSINSSNEKSTVEAREKETKIIETQIIRDREPAAIQGPPEAPRVIVEYDNSDQLVIEANRLFSKRKFPEASSIVDELIRRRPNFVRAWVMKGSLMYVRGQKELAKTAWRQALALEPDNRDIKSIIEKYR